MNFVGKISAEAPVLFTRFVVFGLKDLYAIFDSARGQAERRSKQHVIKTFENLRKLFFLTMLNNNKFIFEAHRAGLSRNEL